LVKALREWRVDGVIVTSSRVGALYQPLLKEIGAPIVLINNQNRANPPRAERPSRASSIPSPSTISRVANSLLAF